MYDNYLNVGFNKCFGNFLPRFKYNHPYAPNQNRHNLKWYTADVTKTL